jgi:hypothetical protein
MRHLLVFVLAVACAAAIAQAPLPQPRNPPVQAPLPRLTMPSLEEITGQDCSADYDSTPEHGILVQDPLTLYWSGRVYANKACVTPATNGYANHFEGCIVVQWDPTGTSYTVESVVWRRDLGVSQGVISSTECFKDDHPPIA